ncbi:Methyl-accepting chemotaxis protein [Neorhizobium galegae bv. officinalis bv. officinalis str. HAMBI 1141]|uniref:Methyl-accepting chemotaxis protein n=2 Tax=Rhizobium/Agrobacterium group TaxID=227290 RepID=A0A068TAM8_NEOGA|nr:Methyl-accepting chemotaxis protein [Neorhizobium galegae bv. officinalis bv. officinalis str. HAMBI 1141]
MRISIKHTLILAFVVLSLGILGLVGKMLSQEIDRYRNSTRLSELAQLDEALFNALIGLRGERGGISSAIKMEPAEVASSRKNMDTGRESMDKAFSAVKTLTANVEQVSLRNTISPVLNAYTQWAGYRATVDTALMQAVKDRDPALGKAVLGLADTMLADLEKAANQVEATINARGPGMIMFTQIRSLAWTARTQLGTANSTFVSALIAKQPLAADKLTEIAVQDARVATAWDVITQLSNAETTPEKIKTLYRTAQTTYFAGPYAEQRNGALKAFQAGKPFDMAVDDWRKPAAPAQASIADMASAALDEMTRLTAEEVASAKQSITIYSVATLIAFALSLLGIYTVIVRIANPISRLTGVMRTLAGGDLSVEIPGAARTDEIGDMARAVEIFREAAQQNRQLEADAESSRKAAEAERAEFQRRAESEAEERLTQATSELASGLQRLAAGDLLCEIDRQFSAQFESLRHDFNSSVRQLRTALEGVNLTAQGVRSGSDEISTASDQLSKRTEQQAASLEQTAAALEEVTTNVKQTSERASEAREIVRDASSRAQNSSTVVSNAVNAMQKIEMASNQISQIIGVIDEIAFQTNLLALNAGVEAARAGEAGKGFAVVAQEVRELAQRSAKAAKEIKTLIGNSEAAVNQGVVLVNDTGDGLKEIAKLVAAVNQHMEAIAIAANEQALGLSEINTSVNHMDQMTQQNAAMVEEMNAAGATLAQESSRLSELLARFEVSRNNGRDQRSFAPGRLAMAS